MNEYQYRGSRWWKFDFHTHTPASLDYRGDKNITPRQWLQDYLAKGIQCLVISDHNTGGWIERLKSELDVLKKEDLATWKDMTLFPAMELSCNGGVHLISILAPEKGGADIEAIRGSVDYQGSLGDSNDVTSLSVEQVIDKIHSVGGIALAAHIDQPKGLLTAIFDHHTLDAIFKKLDAVEVITLDAECLQKYESKLNALACVLGSDSHKPSEIDRGFTWVKMSAPSLEGLRLALLDPESTIRRSDETTKTPQSFPEQWIRSITLENMHLRRPKNKALTLQFNPAYNAIIGGRGSGKSTVLECLRLALARENELRKLGEASEIWKTFEGFRAEYKQRDKPGMMLSETKITVEVVKGSAESSQHFQFIWSKANNRFVPTVLRKQGNEWLPTGLDEIAASTFFPVKIFSQKQILALANNPQTLLEYIDDSIREEKNEWKQKFDECKSALLATRLRVRTLRNELGKKPALELEYNEAKRKAVVFTNANFAPLLKAYQRAMQQKRALDDFYQLLSGDVTNLRAGVEQAAALSSIDLAQFIAESDAEKAARDRAMTLKNNLVLQYQQVASIVSSMQRQIEEVQAAQATSPWQLENQRHIEIYQQETARLKNEGINSAQAAALAIASEEKLRKQLAEINLFESEMERAKQSVNDAAQNLTTCRKALTQKRKQFIDGLFKQNDTLRISLRCMANMGQAVGELKSILRLDGGGEFKSLWDESDDDATPRRGLLWSVVDPNSNEPIENRLDDMKSGIENKDRVILTTSLQAPLLRRLEALPVEAFDELAWWFPEDEVILEYRPRKDASYKNINQASAGQKTAAMLSLLLVHGTEPLLIDQPEDDLDNALVSELVVEQLRKNKEHRQLLVVTHNANIVVNADADLVMTMDFNGGQITLASEGGLQETSVRKDICRVMEGGEQAFRQRFKRILEDLKEKT